MYHLEHEADRWRGRFRSGVVFVWPEEADEPQDYQSGSEPGRVEVCTGEALCDFDAVALRALQATSDCRARPRHAGNAGSLRMQVNKARCSGDLIVLLVQQPVVLFLVSIGVSAQSATKLLGRGSRLPEEPPTRCRRLPGRFRFQSASKDRRNDSVTRLPKGMGINSDGHPGRGKGMPALFLGGGPRHR